MRTKNITASLAFLAFGAVYAYLTAQLPLRMVGNVPGPSFFPWVLTLCFLGLSCVLLAQGLTAPPAAPPRPGAADSSAGRVAAALLAFAAYLGILPFLGFLLATPPACAALMLAAGEKRPLYILAWSAGMTAFLYLMFQSLFGVPIPAAPDFGP
ncbi:MAG: tripartite tricarboxylate transporter TctB family protein [Candidatus Tectomicrobia bacterium]|uniref:Tripartite tricarboxylate transporter TctB family protein n=1 Tax=Tectimicrobiota bacterium TaxID=2528274 RepID=A0A932MM75_UNCTE|nr:tripartite tricarboxylate transporter TctB family protein [Candidatus Tectomicrobia bacterium]